MSAAPGIIATLSAACDLSANFGLPVFPCRLKEEMVNGELRKAKSPITKHGFKDAVTDLERIEDWWRERPDALVGVPTGASTGLFVVDIDPLAADWYRENAERLACARVHKTLRGHHLLYRMPAVELRNTASKIAPGVDIRAEGGYVIWWPAHGLDAVGDLEDLTPPPQWLVDLQQPAQPASQNSDHPKNSGEGSRNNTLASLAGKMRRAGASVDEIEIALLVMNGRCNPPLPESEVRQLARGFGRYEQGKAEQPKEPAKPLVIEPASAWAGRDPPPTRDWIIQDIALAAGRVTSFLGNGGFGKTMIATQIAVAVASNRDVFDLKVSGGPVVGIFCEDEQADVERRGRAVCAAENIPLSSLDRLFALSRDGESNILATFPDGIMLLTDFYDELDATLAEVKPRLCIIDTAADVFAGNFMDPVHVRQFIKTALGGLCKRHDTAVLLLAHPSASAMVSGDGGGFSVAWHNSVRSRLFLRMPKSDDAEAIKDKRVLEVKKSNYGPAGAAFPLAYQAGRFIVDPAPIVESGKGSKAPKVDDELASEIVRFMEKRAPLGEVVSFGPIYEAMQGAGLLPTGIYETVRKPLQRALGHLCTAKTLKASAVPRGYRLVNRAEVVE